jgi:excisionase family DNA binding protein
MTLALAIPDDAVAEIVERVAALVVERMQVESHSWPEWMSVETAARYLDVSPERLRKLQARRQLPYHQEGPGCRVFFRQKELDAAMSEHLQSERGDRDLTVSNRFSARPKPPLIRDWGPTLYSYNKRSVPLTAVSRIGYGRRRQRKCPGAAATARGRHRRV